MTASNPASACPAGPHLELLGGTGIGFANGTYQFFEIRRFVLPPGETSDRDVLTALIASPGYRGSFAGAGDKELTIHGPYRAAAIRGDSFVSVGADDAETWLRTWAEYAAPLPETVRAEVESKVYVPLKAASAVYQLPTLPADATETEWRLALGNSSGFHEFVAIDRSQGVVTLVMATDD